MMDIVHDMRLAVRQWRRHPLLPGAIVLILAAGIGSAVAVFAIAWTVLWRPIDAPDPDRLMWIAAQAKDGPGQSSPGAFAAWEDGARSLSAVAALRPVSGVVSDDRGTDRLRGALVTNGLIGLLDLRPEEGRAFSAEEARPGAPRVLMISYATWQSRYAADPSAIGRSVSFNGAVATIIGVLPESAAVVMNDAAWWSPLVLDAKDRANIGPRYLDIIGRLAPGVSVAAARDELEAMSAALQLKQDDGSPLGVAVTPLLRHLTASYAPSLELLLAAVIGLIAIAAANVATLLLTRAHDRAPEIALRASLGASRAQIARQWLVETAVLGAAALALGLVAAQWLTALLRVLLPADIPRLGDASIEPAATAFAFVLAGLLTMIIGSVSAVRAGASNLQSVLRDGAVGLPGRDLLRRAFVIGQVAIAVVLTMGAALLAQSVRALHAAPRGYDASGVYTTSITLASAAYRNTDAISDVTSRVLADVAVLPGVTGVTAASQLPFAGGSAGADVALDNEAFTEGIDRQVRVRLVAPEYLSTLKGRLREGRAIQAADSAASTPVVVVNSTLARRLVPAGSPVGRAVKFNVPAFNGPDGKRVWTVVGVSDDTWDRGPRRRVEPEVMLPIAQTPSEVFFWISRELHIAVRASRTPGAIAPEVRRAVARIDPGIPMSAGRTLEERVQLAFANEHLVTAILSALGAAGVFLSLFGVAAVISHYVQHRRREIAIRVVLGAPRSGIVNACVRSGLSMVVAGAIVGALVSLVANRALASLLFNVEGSAPATITAVVLAMIVVSALAAWIPARRAAQVDPAEALRR